ncbi:MAG TPA: hypothetical protein VEQ60_08185 [Longimicrobium sp.]|nr:hypothetical protein [Longimicrobium sp.]
MDETEKQELFENLEIEGLTEEELERLAEGVRNTSHGPPCCSCTHCSAGGDPRKWLYPAEKRPE